MSDLCLVSESERAVGGAVSGQGAGPARPVGHGRSVELWRERRQALYLCLIFVLFQSPNVLSAVLCLVKELDLHGLEVVDTAVRCRIQELED